MHVCDESIGPVVRQAQVFLSLERLSQIEIHPLTDFAINNYLHLGVRESKIYKLTQFNPEKNLFGKLDTERHRKKRKVYGDILSKQFLRIFEPTIKIGIDIFLRKLLKSDFKVVNISPLCERLTADIAGH